MTGRTRCSRGSILIDGRHFTSDQESITAPDHNVRAAGHLR
jgi:hypothetical protein